MSPATLRSIERLHAVVAWAATAALVATAWLGARPAETRRAVRLLGAAAVALILTAGGLGLALHDPYRARLRQRLFLDSLELGWLFERKQNAAFAAMLLAVSALAIRMQLERGAPGARDLRRSAALAWAASAALALAASIASTLVARRAHF